MPDNMIITMRQRCKIYKNCFYKYSRKSYIKIKPVDVSLSFSFFAASSLSEIEAASSSVSDIDEYRPKLVRTINRRRFDRALRTIHELCQCGAKEGIKMLTNIHKVLVRVQSEWKYVIDLDNLEH